MHSYLSALVLSTLLLNQQLEFENFQIMRSEAIERENSWERGLLRVQAKCDLPETPHCILFHTKTPLRCVVSENSQPKLLMQCFWTQNSQLSTNILNLKLYYVQSPHSIWTRRATIWAQSKWLRTSNPPTLSVLSALLFSNFFTLCTFRRRERT